MYYFQNDYNSMCHPKVLERLMNSASLHMDGYGNDDACERAAARIRSLCQDPNLSVHFLSGGTQTNLTVICAALRPYQCVIAASSGHIYEHETGAIEANGHKILPVNSFDGKITAAQIEALVAEHYCPNGPGVEHTPQPKLVYISFSTEMGTVYSLDDLVMISNVCKAHSLYLFIDGARLGYGLCAKDCDVTIADIARLSDVFYIGGTKQGAMFGEAVVISNPEIARDFRYVIKQKGGMLAKGWLMGLQFEALLEDDLYFALAKSANSFADQLRAVFAECGFEQPYLNHTNQVFAVLPDVILSALSNDFKFTEWVRIDCNHRMVRFCTSWSTTQKDIDALCAELRRLVQNRT